MEAVGLVSSVLAVIDLCLKYGKVLNDTCATLRDADGELEARILRVRSHWKRTSMQLDFLKRIWNTLDEEYLALEIEILERVMKTLRTANAQLATLKGPSEGAATEHITLSKKNRIKFVFVKERLDEVIQDLASWQQMFDPSWFLIMKVSDPYIDDQLRTHGIVSHSSKASGSIDVLNFRDAAKEQPSQLSSIFLPASGLQSSLERQIKYSSARFVPRAGSATWVVVDSMPYDQSADIDVTVKLVRTLARKMSCDNLHVSGLLQCRGVIRNTANDGQSTTSFDFVFNLPKGSSDEPETLRNILASRSAHTLTERFRLAKQLARSVSYIHTLGFVHKNVRPETVLAFKSEDSALGSIYLVGLQKVRSEEGETLRQGDDSWERNLYRHPDRQGLELTKRYVMQHDIYSLGVCLLEIGLFDSFVEYKEDAMIPTRGDALELSNDSTVLDPQSLKDHLVKIAKCRLPERMGETYTDIVVNCLTCLDTDNPDFGDSSEFTDADGILVGVRYIQKILLKLNGIEV